MEKIAPQPEYDALDEFDAENNVLPARTIAERIAWAYGAGRTHSIVDAIAHAIEDARDIGKRRSALELAIHQQRIEKIDDEHVLPCDFIVGAVRFGKGVKLETVRAAAERWFKMAGLDFEPDPIKLEELRRLFANPPQ